jgi:hypothetical protein
MTRKLTSLAALILIQAGGFLTTPAAAQGAGCTGDFNCSEPGMATTWPLDRVTTSGTTSGQTPPSK